MEIGTEIDSKTQPFLIALRVISILSTIASFSVLFTISLSPGLRSKIFSLLAGYVALSDFLSSLFCAIHFLMISSDFFCQSKAFFASWFNLSAILWMSCLTHILWKIVVKNEVRNVQITLWHHLFCWVFPLSLSILPRVFLDIKWGIWPIEDSVKDEVLDARRVFALGCFFAPTNTTPAWLIEIGGLLPFIFYVSWVFIGVSAI